MDPSPDRNEPSARTAATLLLPHASKLWAADAHYMSHCKFNVIHKDILAGSEVFAVSTYCTGPGMEFGDDSGFAVVTRERK